MTEHVRDLFRDLYQDRADDVLQRMLALYAAGKLPALGSDLSNGWIRTEKGRKDRVWALLTDKGTRTVLDHALDELSLALQAARGHHLALSSVRRVVGTALQIGKLHEERFEAVLRHGIEVRGWLVREGDQIRWASPPVPSPSPSPAQISELVAKPGSLVPADNLPEDWDPPRLLPCGHMDFFHEEEHVQARSRGRCCAGAEHRMMVHEKF